MTTTPHERCRNMILGALVADAAAMGLHWIYDQSRIREIAPDAPEFMPPDPKHYDGVPAFFAHPTRSAGALSQYGEQTMVMLRTLAASKGDYNSAEFATAFCKHFGYGGAYVGYIDHATSGTLDNMRRFEDKALACARSLPFEGDAKTLKSLVAKALPLLPRHSGDDLINAYHNALGTQSDAISAFAERLITALAKLPLPTGAFDLQLPAIAKLPSLIAVKAAQGAAFDDAVTSAVRSTSDHPIAAEYGTICAHMMAGALKHQTTKGAMEAARAVAGPDALSLLDEAVAMAQQDNHTVTKHFGMACDLPFGVPSAAHNIATASSFTDAVRRNIYGGGDSCGRAILVGAVLGAVQGVGGAQGIPQEWIDRLDHKVEVEALLDILFGVP